MPDFLLFITQHKSNKTNVLADMLSDSKKYQNQRSAKLICDPKNIPINQQQEASGLKILIFSSGRLQISRNISVVDTYPSARKIANQPAQQLCCYISVFQTTIHLALTTLTSITTLTTKNQLCCYIPRIAEKQQDYCSVGYAIRQHQI